MLSVVSYEEKGIEGKNLYRRNCSPKLIEDIITRYKLDNLNDYMCGSGTTEDVCLRQGLEKNLINLFFYNMKKQNQIHCYISKEELKKTSPSCAMPFVLISIQLWN